MLYDDADNDADNDDNNEINSELGVDFSWNKLDITEEAEKCET